MCSARCAERDAAAWCHSVADPALGDIMVLLQCELPGSGWSMTRTVRVARAARGPTAWAMARSRARPDLAADLEGKPGRRARVQPSAHQVVERRQPHPLAGHAEDRLVLHMSVVVADAQVGEDPAHHVALVVLHRPDQRAFSAPGDGGTDAVRVRVAVTSRAAVCGAKFRGWARQVRAP